MNLQPKFYDFIKNGTKRIELRLYDEKRQKIKLDDIIEFHKSDKEKLRVKVTGLLIYKNFNGLLNDFDILTLADKSMSKSELLNVLNEFYTLEQQDKYGVIGIKIDKCE